MCYLNACKCKKGYVGDGISECMFSRILYEKQLKKKNAVEARMDIVESDVAEVRFEPKSIHYFRKRLSASSPSEETLCRF